jgi:hypothetical protein
MKRILLVLAAGCGAAAHPGSGGKAMVIDAANGLVDGKYHLTMMHGDAMSLPNGTEKDGAIDFMGGKVALRFGASPSVCEISVSQPGAAMTDGPRIGDPLEVWSRAYGATRAEPATGATGFEHGKAVVTVENGKVVAVRLGSCE